MTENLEIEYKVMLSKEEYERLLNNFPGNESFTQINSYYSSYKKPEVLFRIRFVNNYYLFTYKEIKGEGRLEHEIRIKSDPFNNKELLDYLKSIGLEKPFIKKGELTTERTVTYLDNEAELCLDKNYYRGITDYEIEYEVKGNGTLEKFKKILAGANISYIPSKSSKMARALNL